MASKRGAHPQRDKILKLVIRREERVAMGLPPSVEDETHEPEPVKVDPVFYPTGSKGLKKTIRRKKRRIRKTTDRELWLQKFAAIGLKFT